MPVNSSRLIKIIKNNKGKRVKATDVISGVSAMAPIVSKLIKSNVSAPPTARIEDININKSELEKIYERLKSVKENNENIIKLFPDIELSIQILVSTILSPKNMMDTYLTYAMDKTVASPAITAAMLEIIKNHMTNIYKLEQRLPEITREALFEKGAYVLAVIPESSVDSIINNDLVVSNVSTEKYKSAVSEMVGPIGLIDSKVDEHLFDGLDSKYRAAMEQLFDQSRFIITDNHNLLKYPAIKDKVLSKIIHNKIRRVPSSLSMEALDYFDIFRNSSSNGAGKNLTVLPTKDDSNRESLGSALVIKINTESVIPIFTPGDPSNHIGYIFILDENGYPINSDMSADRIQSLQKNFASPGNTNQGQITLTQKAVNNLIGDSSNVGIGAVYNVYKEIVEKQLSDKVKKGLYGADIELADKSDIYFTMFTRALANQKSSMLFVPAELIAYIAFDYNKNGTGRTLLENMSVLASLRAIMLFAKIMAYSKSAIDVTEVSCQLDPNDPDPEKTIEMIQDSVIKMRQNYFPLGVNNPVDLVDWIQRAGLKFSFENHPGVPNVKMDFTNANLEHTVPADELEEIIRKQMIMSMGLSPETVDNGFSPDFATTIDNNNVLSSKRTAVHQVKLETHLKKIAKMALINDEDLRYQLRKEITAHIGDFDGHLTTAEKALFAQDKPAFYNYILDKMAREVSINLPRPDSTNLTNMAVAFDLYKENLDKALDSILSTEIISPDIGGELSNHVDSVKNVYRHYLLRKWMSDNNFMPEAFGILNQTDEGEDKLNLNDIMKNHIAAISLASADLFKKIEDSRTAVTSDLKKAGVLGLDGGEATTSSSSSSSSDSGDSGGGGGGGDFGMGGGGDDPFSMPEISADGGSDTDTDTPPDETTATGGEPKLNDDEPPIV